MRDRLVSIDAIVPMPDYDVNWEKKKVYSFQTLPILIEYLAGETRTKVSDDGFVMSGIMPAAYGCILRTTDAHGEEIDMYLAPMPKSDADIYVIDQINPASGLFDEHKVMLGFGSMDEAVHIYTNVFADGTGAARIGAVTTFPADLFPTWLTTDGAPLKPACVYKVPEVVPLAFVGITQNYRPHQDMPAPRDEAGGVIVELPDLSKGPKIKTTSSQAGCFDYHLCIYSGLDMQMWSNTVDTFCRILDLATSHDTMHIHLASPGGSVILMGRMLSAMSSTKAKVITYAEGIVASAATAIWAAGHERHIHLGARFMQHMSSQMLAGKTTDIAAKSIFCADYVEKRLRKMVDLKLFTKEEVDEMVEGKDIFISGREAIARVGKIST